MRFIDRKATSGRERHCPAAHAANIGVSCGHVLAAQEGLSALRCDLVPEHSGEHHCCGSEWEVRWGLVVDVAGREEAEAA